jgi:hypothetical protein
MKWNNGTFSERKKPTTTKHCSSNVSEYANNSSKSAKFRINVKIPQALTKSLLVCKKKIGKQLVFSLSRDPRALSIIH